MNSWDSLETSKPLSQEELNARLVAKEEYKKLVLLEEISWRQKSREIWLKEGDRNIGFFHKMANAHRQRNSILRIKIDGNWLFKKGR